MDDILLYSLAANSRTPADYEIGSVALSVEPYGIMMRKDDPSFKKIANDEMTRLYKSGEINAIYEKWFLKPVPPKGPEPQRADERAVQESRRQSDRFGRPGSLQ